MAKRQLVCLNMHSLDTSAALPVQPPHSSSPKEATPEKTVHFGIGGCRRAPEAGDPLLLPGSADQAPSSLQLAA